MDWIKLGQDIVQLQAFENTVLNLQIPQNQEYLDQLDNCQHFKEDLAMCNQFA